MNEAKNDTKGIEYTETDIVTGETYTTTLPCGAALPNGAVYTCNCVAGRGGCACVGLIKSNRSGAEAAPTTSIRIKEEAAASKGGSGF